MYALFNPHPFSFIVPQQLLVMEEGGHEDTTKKNQELLTFGQDLELLIKYKYELK